MAAAIEEILACAKKAGASDVHITVGIPPKMRVNGTLITMEGDRLMPQDTQKIADSVMNDLQRSRFEEHGEVDMSFAVAGEGRFRVNIYKQRGSVAMAFRLVDTVVPSP
jgi:twitching motility protein PilT